MLGIVPEHQIRTRSISRPEGEVIKRYYALSKADIAGLVARALDKLGIATSVPSTVLGPVQPGRFLVGPAITVRNIPIQPVPYSAWQQQTPTLLGEREAFFLAEQGDVIVIDGSSVFPASCLGSMAVALAARLGVAGVVVSGAVTGLPGIRTAEIPVWARGGTTLTGHQRVETIEINGPIGVEGVRVNPGDLVVADDSGVTFVPQPLIIPVLEEAVALSSKSKSVRDLLEQNADRESIRANVTNFIRSLTES